MRCIITMNLEKDGQNYPKREKVASFIGLESFENTYLTSLQESDPVKYGELTEQILVLMPALLRKRENIIFYGINMKNNTDIIVTQSNESQVTVRLFNSNLDCLQKSVISYIKSVMSLKTASIDGNQIRICEKAQEEDLIEGVVIKRLFREVLKRDKKNFSIAFSIGVFIAVFLFILYFPGVDLAHSGNLSITASVAPVDPESFFWKIFPALFTTTLVSILSIVQVAWELRDKTVVWSVAGKPLI